MCKKCGECCSYEIPLTILDIHRIGEELGLSHEEVFSKIVQEKSSTKSSLFKIEKKEDGSCIFLSEDDRCEIHDFRPRVCEFYFCDLSDEEGMESWTSEYVLTGNKSKLWEQSIAIQVTNVYIKKHRATFYEEEFENALDSILDNVKTDPDEKVRLGKRPEGNVCGMVYDCSECEYRKGEMAEETIITLSDVKRIKENLDITYQELFDKFISNEKSGAGTLKLKRDGTCVFFDEEEHCTIEHFRPMHCKFTPCPGEVNDDIESCLYLGSGKIEEQYEHHVSLEVTKRYVEEIGLNFDEKSFSESLHEIEQMINDESNLRVFCKKISPYRYVDDTKELME